MITRMQATVAIGMITFRLLFPEPSWLAPFAALLTLPPLPLWDGGVAETTADEEVALRTDVDVDVVDIDVDITGTGKAVVTATAGTEAEATGTLTAGAGTETEAEVGPTGAVVETAAIRAGEREDKVGPWRRYKSAFQHFIIK
jgi:hypothetical protein